MIDSDKLLGLMTGRRWFGGDHRGPQSARVLDHVVAEEGSPDLILALTEVTFADGSTDMYHLALLRYEDGGVADAVDDVDRLRRLGWLLAHGNSLKGEHGTFHFAGPGLDPMAPPGQQTARAIGSEQSNTSLVLDDDVIVKIFRRVEAGSNPDLELTRTLTNAGFEHIPAQVGEMYYEGTIADEPLEVDLAIAQRFVTGATDGWEGLQRRVRELYDQVHDEDAREDTRFLTEQRASGTLDALEKLGDAIASMHIFLSHEEEGLDLTPDPIDPVDLKEWVVGASQSLRQLIDEGVTELAELEEPINNRLEAVLAVEDAGSAIRVHGDLHMGQVLSTSRGWLILDFEGEPARSLEERRTKQSPLKDVAGMLRSFGYASVSVLFERSEVDSEEWKRLESWGDAWEELARDRFIAAYHAKSHEGRFLPADRESFFALLDFFELDKALYEVGYERAHRPEWMRIPLRGIERILQRETQ